MFQFQLFCLQFKIFLWLLLGTTTRSEPHWSQPVRALSLPHPRPLFLTNSSESLSLCECLFSFGLWRGWAWVPPSPYTTEVNLTVLLTCVSRVKAEWEECGQRGDSTGDARDSCFLKGMWWVYRTIAHAFVQRDGIKFGCECGGPSRRIPRHSLPAHCLYTVSPCNVPGLQIEGIFRRAANVTLVKSIQNRYNSGE